METEKLLKEYRKKALFLSEELPHRELIGRKKIEKILPHRPPMLLIDAVTGLDTEKGLISGERYIDPGDPVFAGHFPRFPVYPGVLEVEMIGQLGLCLYYFVTHNRTTVGEDAQPVDIRATRILGAHYLEPLIPGTTARILARKMDYDGFFGTAVGQIIADGKICCVAAGEVVFP